MVHDMGGGKLISLNFVDFHGERSHLNMSVRSSFLLQVEFGSCEKRILLYWPRFTSIQPSFYVPFLSTSIDSLFTACLLCFSKKVVITLCQAPDRRFTRFARMSKCKAKAVLNLLGFVE